MKKMLMICLLGVNIFYCSSVAALDKIDPGSCYEENYSYNLTDNSQLKQAVGMTVTGIVMFIAIGLISGLIPPEADINPTTFDQPFEENTLLD